MNAQKANQHQSEAWNGTESVHYVDHADPYDRQVAPFADALLERARLEPHESVLDVGCGCGVTALLAAHSARIARGVEISEPLLEVAAARAGTGSVDNVCGSLRKNIPGPPVAPSESRKRDVLCHGTADYEDPLFRLEFLPTAEHCPAAGCERTSKVGECADWIIEEHQSELTDDDVEGTVFERVGLRVCDRKLHARSAAIEAVRASLAERYEPGVGIRLGSGAWLVSAHK